MRKSLYFLKGKKTISKILKKKILFYLGYFGFRKTKLPDFLVIGVQKSGTTSLHYHLNKHPQIELVPNFINLGGDTPNSKEKEIHFFDRDKNCTKGIHWYKSNFNNNRKLQGEITPDYISSPLAIERISKTLPHTKLIIILRNPVTRALSAFNHQKQQEVCWERGFSFQNHNFNSFILSNIRELEQTNLIRKGFYADQIEHVYKYFKKEQVLILISEQMKKDPQKTYSQIFKFLGVEDVQIPHDPNVHKREYQETMNEETRKKLEELYRQYNEHLYELLGYRIKEWE